MDQTTEPILQDEASHFSFWTTYPVIAQNSTGFACGVGGGPRGLLDAEKQNLQPMRHMTSSTKVIF
jgi:hypothetical protein